MPGKFTESHTASRHVLTELFKQNLYTGFYFFCGNSPEQQLIGNSLATITFEMRENEAELILSFVLSGQGATDQGEGAQGSAAV